jgi:hypothetical protein
MKTEVGGKNGILTERTYFKDSTHTSSEFGRPLIQSRLHAYI